MLKLSPKMWYLLKYGFLVLISIGVLLTILPVSKPEKGPDWLDLLPVNLSDFEINSKLSPPVLREEVTDCFINIKEKHEEMHSFKKERMKNFYENVSSDPLNDKHAVFTVLTSFSNLLSLLHIKAAIIEPSLLYCMLIPKYQELLSKRQFNVSDFSGSNRVITFGVMLENIAVLQQERNIDKFSILGFKVHFITTNSIDWSKRNIASHVLFKHKLCTIHLVVFQKRNQYYMHAAMDLSDGKKFSEKKLLFTEHDGAYEKFLFVSLENKILPVADFYVPSNTHYFLFEIMSSRFLECNFSRTEAVFSKDQPRSHPDMSVEQFNRRTLFALRELKKIFHPLLMHLWIWSGTMLGWYRQCDIIPYTTDVDFASWASDVDDLDLIINLIKNSKYMTIKERMGFLQEALELHIDCHDLRIDIFFTYQIENGSWCSGHSPKLGYYFRYFYPPFTLCSSDLLGEKVQVPCETEAVITAEYGPEWNKPVTSWHYESSPKNRGPNIYWEKDKMKYAYKNY